MREIEHRMIKEKSNREYGEVWRMGGGQGVEGGAFILKCFVCLFVCLALKRKERFGGYGPKRKDS